jgi:hypothetical protein
VTIHVSTLRLATLRQLVLAGKNLRFGVNILGDLTIRITSVFINHDQDQDHDQESDLSSIRYQESFLKSSA